MIQDLDKTLAFLFSQKADRGSELSEAEISFSVPDREWQGDGHGLDLNVYLYDIRENRELRTNESQYKSSPGGSVTQIKPVPRVDCAYIITAWNKATRSLKEDREFQEHRLLTQVLRVLLRHPRVPSDCLKGSLTGQEPDLPVIAAQKQGLPDPVEFWSALGCAVRPSINCVVTISLNLDETESYPTVKKKKMQFSQKP